MGLVQSVRTRIAAKYPVAVKIGEKGCKVSLADAPQPRLIVDFRNIKPQDRTHCDYLFVADAPKSSGWVVLLELKGKGADIDHAANQLQSGADTAEQFVSSALDIHFRPILVSKSMSKAERKALKKGKAKQKKERIRANREIRFHRHSEPVRRIRSGDPLAKALRS